MNMLARNAQLRRFPLARYRAAAALASGTVARGTPEAFLAELEAARPDIDLGLNKSLELLARCGML